MSKRSAPSSNKGLPTKRSRLDPCVTCDECNGPATIKYNPGTKCKFCDKMLCVSCWTSVGSVYVACKTCIGSHCKKCTECDKHIVDNIAKCDTCNVAMHYHCVLSVQPRTGQSGMHSNETVDPALCWRCSNCAKDAGYVRCGVQHKCGPREYVSIYSTTKCALCERVACPQCLNPLSDFCTKCAFTCHLCGNVQSDPTSLPCVLCDQCTCKYCMVEMYTDPSTQGHKKICKTCARIALAQ